MIYSILLSKSAIHAYHYLDVVSGHNTKAILGDKMRVSKK